MMTAGEAIVLEARLFAVAGYAQLEERARTAADPIESVP